MDIYSKLMADMRMRLTDINIIFRIIHGWTLEQISRQAEPPPPPDISWHKIENLLKACPHVEIRTYSDEIYLLCDEILMPIGGKPKPNDLVTQGIIKNIQTVLKDCLKENDLNIQKFYRRQKPL
ncbi:hypothetical protein [Microcystis aeruginosa]|uniref:hypothetical protein n=1 Tax=Microcystis aeruginosa TaxID=1126 RepID=UPI00232DC093|nr:hypothetical protein [Microcystis aeruginosa]MDB9431961.1 hypothetical protein [Microcystis aeruginosa CS-552/01]